jgi:tetratricopeptide (TPR) repeat protein
MKKAIPIDSQVSERGRTFVVAAMIVVGMLFVVLLTRWTDAHKPAAQTAVEEESLYLNGSTARRLSLGFNGLAADWYWMRSLQYVGRKILSVPENMVLDDLTPLNLKLLPALLDNATTLDPQFLEPYQYAAVVLPSINVEEAIRLTNKGIAANPKAWRLYQHLGYIYWQQHDYQTASAVYGKGAKLPNAPPWMEAMSARMATEGGSRSVGREIYGRMYEQAADDKVKDMARKRLMQLDSLDERDALRQVLAAYQSRLSRCPSSWREIEAALRTLKWRTDSTGAPLDPSAAPYVLVREGCVVDLSPQSEVPRK